MNYYELTIKNKGELVMPVILEFTLKDGSKKTERIPVEIWRRNDKQITKVFFFEQEVTSVVLDPYFGSGTTGEEAEKLGRYWVGFEVVKEYVAGQKGRFLV
jgi:hypothetical protein